MTKKTILQSIRPVARKGGNPVEASDSTFGFDPAENINAQELDQLVKSLTGNGPDVVAARNGFLAAAVEPIFQIIPYVEVYDRFFMQMGLDPLADNRLPLEDLVGIAYSSHPQAGIFYSKPGYLWTRPTFSTYQGGTYINWDLVAKAGWNVLARALDYVSWDLARKRDAAAKVVIDAAIPTSHKLTSTGALNKAGVDEVIRKSNQIGFPVKMAIINPGRMMDMATWTWGNTGVFLPFGVTQELLDSLMYSNYGGLRWYASPNVPATDVYFAGDPNTVGWHQTRGTPRQDSAIDIDRGIDKYALRDAEHAWYIPHALSLWHIAIA